MFLLSCVDSHVVSQVATVTKTLATLTTLKRFLPGVRSHVAGQGATVTKTLATLTTLIRCFTGMNL